MANLLNTLPGVVDKRKQRVGRGIGSGRGSKSGRGTTRHQKARGKIPLHFEGGQAKMVKKFPLLRGKSKNKSVQEKAIPVSIGLLSTISEKEVVNLETLAKHGIIDTPTKTTRVKIVAGGKLEKKLTIALPVSQSAGKLIEKAGGKVETAWKK